MKLRYVRSTSFFIPEIQMNPSAPWTRFTKSQIKNSRIIKDITECLSNIETGSLFSSPFSSDDTLIFASEICCMAFLGAATVHFRTETKEFPL